MTSKAYRKSTVNKTSFCSDAWSLKSTKLHILHSTMLLYMFPMLLYVHTFLFKVHSVVRWFYVQQQKYRWLSALSSPSHIPLSFFWPVTKHKLKEVRVKKQYNEQCKYFIKIAFFTWNQKKHKSSLWSVMMTTVDLAQNYIKKKPETGFT